MGKSNIYTGQFRYDDWSQMIFVESAPHLVAQLEEEDAAAGALLLMRGWGGLHTILGQHTALKVQDAFGRRVAELLNNYGLGDELMGLLSHSGNKPVMAPMMSLDCLNRKYGTNYTYGMQILVHGLPCQIVGSDGCVLFASTKGMQRLLTLHPTSGIEVDSSKGTNE